MINKRDNLSKKLARKTKNPAAMLRALREREGLSQAAMAKKIKTTQTYISILELEKAPITRKMAEKIAKKFKMEVSVFYTEKK